MRFFAGLLGIFLLATLSQANVVPRRTNRNTEEILVPVTIIQDGEEIKEPGNLKEIEKEAELKNLQPEVIAENIVAAVVEEEQKLEAVEAVVQAQRRIDEAIVEQEINEAIKQEQDKENEQENKLKTIEMSAVPAIGSGQQPIKQIEEASALRSAAEIAARSPEQTVVAVLDAENTNNANDVVQEPEGSERQATQATPTQTTTQQNFVQQLIQNSPLGQFFNQITGQTQAANSEGDATPAPPLPGIFNPVAAVQSAAQSVVNTTTQAFQGLQQFASNLGNQFQSTLSGLGGQPLSTDPTTPRPPGPIQQLVNSFIPQPPQPPAPQQGPLQGLFNIFQGRPQQAATSTETAAFDSQPAKEPEIQEQPLAASAEASAETSAETSAGTSAETADQANNEVRDSGETNDSFEESVKPEELIIVNDDATQTDNDAGQEIARN